MNSKVWLIIAAAVIVVGGLFAVRNLTTPSDVPQVSERVDESDQAPASEEGAGDAESGKTRVTSLGGSKPAVNRAGAPRTFNRGKSAASIDVTPITTSALQTATLPVTTPETTTTEESKDESRQIADLVNMFHNQTDPDDRIDIADQLGMIDNPAAVARVLELLKDEKDPAVQEALLEALQGLDALEDTGDEVLRAVVDIYQKTDDPDVKSAAQDVLGDVATPAAADALWASRNAAADPVEKLNAAENLMRISATNPKAVSVQQVEELTIALKEDYQTGPDAAYRSQAIMALAVHGPENVDFFQQALQTEQDAQLHNLLERLVRSFTAAPPATPPPGTVVTPVPTPDYSS